MASSSSSSPAKTRENSPPSPEKLIFPTPLRRDAFTIEEGESGNSSVITIDASSEIPELNGSTCSNGNSQLLTSVAENPLAEEDLDRLRKCFVFYKGEAVGTVAASDPSVEALNYDQTLMATPHHQYKYLDGKSLVMLATTCKWFHKTISEECVWKFACLRDLGVPNPGEMGVTPTCFASRRNTEVTALYDLVIVQTESSIDDESSMIETLIVTYKISSYRTKIYWKRIGAFFLESSEAVVAQRIPQKLNLEEILQSRGFGVLTNIKTGIWIADLHLLRCPVCNLDSCEGTMLTLDARNFELFMNEGYQDGSWVYTQIGSYETKKHMDGTSGAIFDMKHLKDASTAEIFDTESWTGKENDLHIEAKLTLHAVAANTNLEPNEGINVKFHIMRAGTGGQIMAIRVSQHLVPDYRRY